MSASAFTYSAPESDPIALLFVPKSFLPLAIGALASLAQPRLWQTAEDYQRASAVIGQVVMTIAYLSQITDRLDAINAAVRNIAAGTTAAGLADDRQFRAQLADIKTAIENINAGNGSAAQLEQLQLIVAALG